MVRPKVTAEGQKELEKVESQFNSMEKERQSLDYDQRLNAPKHEYEPQTKMALSEIDQTPKVYLKPKRSFPPGVDPKTGKAEQFNEKFCQEYNYKKEYVEFIAENNEIIGESADFWVKKFPGTALEEWVIPMNKPIWAPRYVKERLEECGYTVFRSSQSLKSEEGINYTGYLEIQERKNRLNARDVPKKRNIYMGNHRFAA